MPCFRGISLTLIPGFAGWYLLRRRPLKRIRAIQAQAELIVAGDLTHRLPLSARRDELDMLAAIVNAMLDRIERLMHEVKGVCDNIAHDLRTPLTRLRAQLYRIRQQSDADSTQAEALDQAISETDTLMARFRGLLRISELEDRQRRAGFVQLDPHELLVELHDFYLPLAEDGGIRLELQQPAELPALHGDRELLFEALANLVGNGIKFTPEGGLVRITATQDDNGLHLAIEDSGPGIPEEERAAVLKRFYRSDEGHRQCGVRAGVVDRCGDRRPAMGSGLGGGGKASWAGRGWCCTARLRAWSSKGRGPPCGPFAAQGCSYKDTRSLCRSSLVLRMGCKAAPTAPISRPDAR
ncbi:integral membrane sensor signal transduction histidine kinase [Pseudomonas putida S11]|nr:integral membrane sensor signal transduction histidine kinase [Pseudomonas putida S11]